MTSRSFCSWANDTRLPNTTLEPGAPRKASVEVARRWLHTMGFTVKRITKGIYVDGHERQDVIEARDSFLKKMTSLGFSMNQIHQAKKWLTCYQMSSSPLTSLDSIPLESTFKEVGTTCLSILGEKSQEQRWKSL